MFQTNPCHGPNTIFSGGIGIYYTFSSRYQRMSVHSMQHRSAYSAEKRMYNHFSSSTFSSRYLYDDYAKADGSDQLHSNSFKLRYTLSTTVLIFFSGKRIYYVSCSRMLPSGLLLWATLKSSYLLYFCLIFLTGFSASTPLWVLYCNTKEPVVIQNIILFQILIWIWWNCFEWEPKNMHIHSAGRRRHTRSDVVCNIRPVA